MSKSAVLRLIEGGASTSEIGKVPNRPPRRKKNADVRSREYLTSEEMERLINAARRHGRHGHRDATLLLVAYRHGFRVGELVRLKWEAVDFQNNLVRVTRLKNGKPAVHPLKGPVLRDLRRLHKQPHDSVFVFETERGGPLNTRTVHHIVAEAGAKAGFDFPVHPHMLRHACGYALVNDHQDLRAIQNYLGHKNISHTVRYTELTAEPYGDFWGDW